VTNRPATGWLDNAIDTVPHARDELVHVVWSRCRPLRCRRHVPRRMRVAPGVRAMGAACSGGSGLQLVHLRGSLLCSGRFVAELLTGWATSAGLPAVWRTIDPHCGVLVNAMAPQSHSHARSRAHQGYAMSNESGSTTGAQHSAHPVRPLALQLQPLELVLVAGLAGLFVVNAIVAVVEPSDVTGLVERSLVGRMIPAMNGRWVAWVVAVNDLTIGAALLAAMWIPRARPLVLAWAGAWLFAVALIKLTSLAAFGG
jgi:hypothetical protein